ncbi:unnamed protein product [Phytophthora fragariaefolia]|uniref:Unnamed protein product n=1 Tax=Phytophthora fragariaefolia TaxID=1490495 RepID=A0A9W6XB86_9STRA|nr:unnamed protein product [Phytophthora fragariaefolia]
MTQPFAFGWNLDCEGKPILGNGSDERPFIVGLSSKALIMRVMHPPGRFILHVDETYKLSRVPRHWPILAPLYPPSPKREAPVPMGKSSGNTGTAPFDNSRSHEHKPHLASLPGMTTETQMILGAAPDALVAAGPAEHDADALTPSAAEAKLPAPVSQKHSGDPEETTGTSASKKYANDVDEAKRTPAPEEPTIDAEAARKPPASQALAAAAAQKKKTSASAKPTQKTTASSNRRRRSPRTTWLPLKRTDVLLPGPQEEVNNDSPDTDTPNPALVTGADPPVVDASQAPSVRTSTIAPAASANFATTPPPNRSPSPDPSLRVDYEESEPDMDREAGEVEGSWSSPPLTDEQRVLHPGSPMSPKTVAAVACASV